MKTDLWKNRNFRLVFGATAISNLGDGIAMVAYPWLATLISRDPLDIAFVAFASRLPWFLMSLPAGVITDRVSHQRLMVGADIFRFLLTLAVVALVMLGPELPAVEPARGYILLLALAAFLLGAAEVLRDNTAQTIFPRLVDARDLAKANGTMWSAEQIIGEFVGPPLAGFLIALALPLPFALDALSFAIAAVLVSRLRPRPAPAAPHPSALTSGTPDLRSPLIPANSFGGTHGAWDFRETITMDVRCRDRYVGDMVLCGGSKDLTQEKNKE